MRQLLIILLLFVTAGAWAQVNPNSITNAYQSLASAIKYPKEVGFKFDVIENGVISHFVTMQRSDAYLKPDSIMVIAMADSVSIAVRQAQEVQVEWFKLPGEKDWYNAFQRLARYASARPGTTISLNPVVYNIDTFKAGTPIPLVNTSTKDSLITDSSGNVIDTIVVTTYDTVLHITSSYTPNNITDITWMDPQNLHIKGNGAKINIRGNFERKWTHTNASGYYHFSAYNTVCPFAIAWGKNITIEGLEIDGNDDEMTESGGVAEGVDYGITFRGTDGITLKNCYIHHIATDGLYIEGSGPSSVNGPNGGISGHASRSANVQDVKIEYCGRQALTIGGLSVAYFLKCHFDKTADTTGMGLYRGHSPEKGLDIEPIYQYAGGLVRTDRMTSDITFDNCTFFDNQGGCASMSFPLTVSNITFIHCALDNSKYNRLFNVISTIGGLTFDNCNINTGTGAMYLTRDAGASQRVILQNSTLLCGGSGFILGQNAQYGVIVNNNYIKGSHTTNYKGYFPAISSGATFTNNTIEIDSALYLGTGQARAAQIYTSIAEGNTYLSQMDTTGGRMYNIIYTYPKTMSKENYTAKQAVRPYGGWDVAASDYTGGKVGIGAIQVVNAGLGKPEIKQYWSLSAPTTNPATGLYKKGDVIWMIDPVAAGYNLYRCTVGGDFTTSTHPTFVPVGAISATGAPVYHNAQVVSGSDYYIGRSVDSGGTSKMAHALLPNGGVYFTKSANDTGIVAFKSPLAFTNTGEIIIKGTIYQRGKGNADFTVSSLTLGNHTFVNNNLTITGDSSLLGIKARWLKDANNDVYLSFFDTTSVLTHQTTVHLESITLSGSTQSYLDHTTQPWTPMVIRSLSGYTATVVPNTAIALVATGGTGSTSFTANRLNYFDGSKIASSGIAWDNTNGAATINASTGDGLIISRVIGGVTNELRFGGADGRTVSVYQNGTLANLNYNANQIVYNSVLKIGATKALVFASYDGTNTGYGLMQVAADGGLYTQVNSINAQVINSSGTTIFGGKIRLKEYTVATLPASSTASEMSVVTDALNPVNGSAVVGGGTTRVPVFYNGANWLAFGAAGSIATAANNTVSVTTATATVPNVPGTKTIVLVNFSSGTSTVTLPAASSNTGKEITIKSITASNVSISGVWINDANTIGANTYNAYTYYSDGTQWYMTARN